MIGVGLGCCAMSLIERKGEVRSGDAGRGELSLCLSPLRGELQYMF